MAGGEITADTVPQSEERSLIEAVDCDPVAALAYDRGAHLSSSYGEPVNLRDHLLNVRAAWKLIIALCVLGAVLGGVLAGVVPPKYVSTTRFFVASAVTSDDPEELFDRNMIATQRVKSYVQLIDSDAMTTAVVEELGDTGPEFDPDFDVESVDIPETVIIDVQVTADSADSAQRLAQAYADVVPAQVSEVESIGTAKAAQVALSVIESPEPGERESPGVPHGIVFGALLGLVLGAGGTILWGAIRRERAADESAKA